MLTWANYGLMPLGYQEFVPMIKACQTRCNEIAGEFDTRSRKEHLLISRPGWKDDDLRPVSPSDRSLIGELDDERESGSGAPIEGREGTAGMEWDDEASRAASPVPDAGSDEDLEVILGNRLASQDLFKDKGARQAAGKAALTSAALRAHIRELAGESGALDAEHGLREPVVRGLEEAVLALYTESSAHDKRSVVLPRSCLDDLGKATAKLLAEVAAHPASLKKWVDGLTED